MLRLPLVVLIAASACAQTPKPDAQPVDADGRSARADSVVETVRRAPGRDSVEVVTGIAPLLAGEVMVEVAIHTAGAGPAFNALNLHDDESTSVDAALAVAQERGGRVVELVHSGERNLTFEVRGRSYVADPNRMFTDAGRRRTLGALSVADPEALDALAAFADEVLTIYTRVETPVVVTLHNNTEGRYSAESYAPGAEYATDAAAVTVHPGSDPDDFFFVTDRALYDALVAQGFNAVLQDNDAATDDGSLSVWAAQQGVPYVNVEAQHGHVAEQARMIRALSEVLTGQAGY